MKTHSADSSGGRGVRAAGVSQSNTVFRALLSPPLRRHVLKQRSLTTAVKDANVQKSYRNQQSSESDEPSQIQTDKVAPSLKNRQNLNATCENREADSEFTQQINKSEFRKQKAAGCYCCEQEGLPEEVLSEVSVNVHQQMFGSEAPEKKVLFSTNESETKKFSPE